MIYPTPLFVFSYHEQIERFAPQPVSRVAVAMQPRPVRCNFSPQAYRAAVRRVIDYIAAGDVFQVNLSQRFTAALGPLTPAQIYQRLLANNPAWMAAMLDYGDFALLSNSPELLLRIDVDPSGGSRILTRPIKGTRPAGPHMQAELLASEKDAAELNMIIDLSERSWPGMPGRLGAGEPTAPHRTARHGFPRRGHGARGFT